MSTWLRCRYAHTLRYVEELQPKAEGQPIATPLTSGSAIHFGIEAALLKGTGLPGARLAADQYLNNRGESGERFRRGVHTALEGVPAEVWTAHIPQVEDELSYVYQPGDIKILGKPDLWEYDENGIYITDYKSTSKDETDRLERYEMWNVNTPFYGVLLSDYLGSEKGFDPPVYVRHIVLSTRGRPAIAQFKPLTRRKIRLMRTMMLGTATQILTERGVDFTGAHPDIFCDGCDFAPVCRGHLTNADVDGILKESFEPRKQN